MRKLLAQFLIILLWVVPVYAENEEIDKMVQESNCVDVSIYSSDALLELRERIDKELIQRGVVSYFDLEMNSKGDEVANLQTRLYELGYYVGNITGKYDSATRQAEKQFEKANQLENDGVASNEDQQVLFSSSAIPKATAVPKVKKAQTNIVLPDINEEEYGEFDYEDTMRYPENHRGEKVKLKGKVVQVIGSKAQGFQIRFSINGNSDIVYIYINELDYNILENDWMTIYASVLGIKTYTSILKQSISIPSLQADCVILKN